MENIVLTVTLRADSGAESELMEHFRKFKSGKGLQDRSFELRRLMVIGFNSQKSFSEIPEVRSNAIRKNAIAQSSAEPSVYSSSSIEDVYQNSSNQFTRKAALSIPQVSLIKPAEKVHESVKVITTIEIDTKRDVEPQTQQNLAVLSISSESVNAENSDPNGFAEIRKSVSAWDFGMAKQAENANVTTGEIT